MTDIKHLLKVWLESIWGTVVYLWLLCRLAALFCIGVFILAGLISDDFWAGVIIASLAVSWVVHLYSHHVALAPGIREISEEDSLEIYKWLAGYAEMAGLPAPKFLGINSSDLNAYSTGRNPSHGVVLVTTGLLAKLDPQELKAVLGHELAHLRNRDARVSMVVLTVMGVTEAISILSGISGWILVGALLLPLSVSWTQEFRADTVATQIGGDPVVLGTALKKLPYLRVLPFLLTFFACTHPPTRLRLWNLNRVARRTRKT